MAGRRLQVYGAPHLRRFRYFTYLPSDANRLSFQSSVASFRGKTMKYEIYRDKKDEYRWRLRHGNGNILSKSSEGYKAKADCLKCIENNKKSADAPIVDC